MMNNIPMNFPITIFDTSDQKVSNTFTKKRCAIFYKGLNRNGSYITDEFAERLVSTLPYAPVKGIYDEDNEDYTDHGSRRDLGRIYGVVPVQNNFAWEKRLDSDGVEREYACTDVYLYTAIYEEANKIDGKGQSMELYPPTIKGKWVDVNGQAAFKYEEGDFLGLQVLGDKATPCFQGSQFFSLNELDMYAAIMTLIEKVDKLSMGGNNQMENNEQTVIQEEVTAATEFVDAPVVDAPVEPAVEPVAEPVENAVTFALSDSQKQNEIFKKLNKDKCQYFVVDTYDDHAIVFDIETEKMFKVAYTKTEDGNVEVSDSLIEVQAVYATAEEIKALDSLRASATAETYAEVAEQFENNKNAVSDLKTQLDEKDASLSTLNTEKENLNQTVETLKGQIDVYTQENTELKNFKSGIERAEKLAVINKFNKKVDADVIAEYTAKVDEFTAQELKEKLAYIVIENDETIFSNNGSDATYVPAESTVSGLEALLTKYKK